MSFAHLVGDADSLERYLRLTDGTTFTTHHIGDACTGTLSEGGVHITKQKSSPLYNIVHTTLVDGRIIVASTMRVTAKGCLIGEAWYLVEGTSDLRSIRSQLAVDDIIDNLFDLVRANGSFWDSQVFSEPRISVVQPANDADVQLVMDQTSTSREAALAALAKHDNDLVEAIMDLTL